MKYNNKKLKIISISLNTLEFQQKYLEYSIALHVPKLYPNRLENMNHKLNLQQNSSLKVYQGPQTFTQPFVAMVMTFLKSVYSSPFSKF